MRHHDSRIEHCTWLQLTPTGSGCSIVIGDLPSQNEMAPGSMRGLQLCVADGSCELTAPGVRRSLLVATGSSRLVKGLFSTKRGDRGTP